LQQAYIAINASNSFLGCCIRYKRLSKKLDERSTLIWRRADSTLRKKNTHSIGITLVPMEIRCGGYPGTLLLGLLPRKGRRHREGKGHVRMSVARTGLLILSANAFE
jgi:hypothetical protein